jgi:hypothetical protein
LILFDVLFCSLQKKRFAAEKFGLPGICKIHFLPQKALSRLPNTLIFTQEARGRACIVHKQL